MTENLSKPGLMIRIADLMYRALKAAIRRWYITIVLVLLLSALPFLITEWKLRQFQLAIIQLKKDNPQIKDWSASTIRTVDLANPFPRDKDFINLSKIGKLKDMNSLNKIFFEDLELCLRNHNINARVIPDFKIKNLTALKGISLKSLDLSYTNISDLSTLKGMQLKSLDLNDTQVEDISALKGMPLEYLNFGKTHVTDISALKGMPLTSLGLRNTQVSDISALKGMPLEDLDLYNTQVEDISALKGMQLQELNFRDTQVKDITPLKGMPLVKLILANTPVSDINGLKGLPLKSLWLNDTKVSDINALKGMPLKNLYLNNTQVSDISPLKDMPLKELFIVNTEISDISILKGMPLIRLKIPKAAENIEFLRSMKTLEDINSKSATDFWKYYDFITPILLELKKDNPQILDWKDLRIKGNLNSLNLSSISKLNDISSLKGIPLTGLNLRNTQVTDISALKGMPLISLQIPKTAKNIEFLRSIKTLKRINGNGIAFFWKDYEHFKSCLLNLKKNNPQVKNWNYINSLSGIPLTSLNLTGTQVKDISALKGVPLKKLQVGGGFQFEGGSLASSEVWDISSLRGMPLKD
ncbi:MAG: hypothetical protein HRT89_04840, partial [Lentisphaeria bacterium]|nr:hypothetical protein [Lentisphaeria bacterium]